ncbi:MAG TPA: VanW family protein [Chloroflexia bacterium]|nr:VanW family protein [Chloroflexia bacterium]
MENPRGREDWAEGQERESAPRWPQRPSRPQPANVRPRLDPPESYRARAQGGNAGRDANGEGARVSSSKWTSHPMSGRNPDSQDDPKDTRVLPVVDTSRFDGGRAAPPPAPAPRSQPQATPRPQPHRRDYYAEPAQPQPRNAGGWEYEQEEPGYDEYDRYGELERTQQYPAQQRIARRAQAAIPKELTRGKAARRTEDYDSSRYLSVDVDVTGVPRKRGPWWILWTLIGVLAIALIGALAFGLAWQGQYAGKIYSGVSVYDIDLGGKTPDEAKELLNDKVRAFMAQPVVLKWNGKEWRPSAEQAGISIDVDATVNEAFTLGRGSDTFGNVSQQWFSSQSGHNIPLTVQFSEPALHAYLSTIAEEEINQEIFEGDVRLNGAEVVALPGKEGRALRVYDAIATVREGVAKLEPITVDLPVEVTQPTVSAGEVEEMKNLLAVRISSPITATALGKVFTLDRDALMRFTTIERNPDRTAQRHIELGWKDNELKIVGERWAKEASRPPQNARFGWNGGTVSILTESIDGFETDTATVVNSIKEHAAGPEKREYELPGKVITPTVSSKDLGALGIKELIGTGKSTFKGSSRERAINIQVAANLLNGAVVPPGGTFSFLEAMGGIDETHGFVEGYVIAAERTQRGVGGGVCQVSTTAFRAAFWSGVEITERNQHSYRVGWYEADGEPVGFDAAVFDPGVDLKFLNNTPGYILVEATVGEETLIVSMYGTKMPGEVKLEGPAISNRVPPPSDVYEVDPRLEQGAKKQVETARAGLSTIITRRIVVPGQPDKIDQYHSTYKAWPNWYIVASASQIPGGGGAPPKPTPNP